MDSKDFKTHLFAEILFFCDDLIFIGKLGIEDISGIFSFIFEYGYNSNLKTKKKTIKKKQKNPLACYSAVSELLSSWLEAG